MQGFALTTASSLEIISAYAATNTVIRAVAATPGWTVVGAFYLPKSASARIDALMMVSDASLTCRVRLYDATAGAIAAASRVVPGYVTTQSLTAVRQLGPVVSLTGGHLYQFQAEVTGDAGDEFFGMVPTATLVN